MDKLINALQEITELAEGAAELEEDFTREQALVCNDALNKILTICCSIIKTNAVLTNAMHSDGKGRCPECIRREKQESDERYYKMMGIR